MVPASRVVFECFEADGIIGSDLLRKWAVKFDSKEKTLSFAKNAAVWNPQKRNSVPVSLTGGRPYLKILAENGSNSKQLFVLFDTGAVGFSLRHFQFQALMEQEILEAPETGYGRNSIGLHGASKPGTYYRGVLPSLSIGDVRFENIPVHSRSGGSCLLGTQFLNHTGGILDYPRKRMYFEPFNEELVFSPLRRRNVSLTIMEGQLTLGMIWNRELYGRVAPGDPVLTINGRSTDEIDPCLLVRGGISLPAGTMLEVRTTEGDVREITVEEITP